MREHGRQALFIWSPEAAYRIVFTPTWAENAVPGVVDRGGWWQRCSRAPCHGWRKVVVELDRIAVFQILADANRNKNRMDTYSRVNFQTTRPETLEIVPQRKFGGTLGVNWHPNTVLWFVFPVKTQAARTPVLFLQGVSPYNCGTLADSHSHCAAGPAILGPGECGLGLRYFADTGGDVHYNPIKWNRHHDNRCYNLELRDAVLDAVEERPEHYLDEVADFVNLDGAQVGDDVEVSVSSTFRIHELNGYARKVIEKAFVTRNEALRTAWVEAQWVIPMHCRVFVDEAHLLGRAAERRWAWSPKGQRAESYVLSSPRASTSFFVAMAHDESLEWLITRPPPGQSSVDFLLFVINHLLPHMDEWDPAVVWANQRERCVVVLDNARVHAHVSTAAAPYICG